MTINKQIYYVKQTKSAYYQKGNKHFNDLKSFIFIHYQCVIILFYNNFLSIQTILLIYFVTYLLILIKFFNVKIFTI